MNDPANTLRFSVTIQGYDIGTFTAVDGLSAHYEGVTQQEGGENTFVHFLPTRLIYDNVKISRALDSRSDALAQWFRSLSTGQPKGRSDATIVAYNGNREVVAQWVFHDVLPIKYTAPSFSTEGGKVAIEILEFAHRGLLSGAQ